MKKYHYLVIFLAGYFVLAPFMIYRIYTGQDKAAEMLADSGMGMEMFWQDFLRFSEKNFTGNEADAVLKGEASEEAQDAWEEHSGGAQDGAEVSEEVGQQGDLGNTQGKSPARDVTGNVQGIQDSRNGQSGAGIGIGDAADGNGSSENADAPDAGQAEPPEESPEEYFQDALFIGDSRTMGLWEYADLQDAAAFANTGMSIYRLYSLKNAVPEQPASLEDILAQKQYRRIFFMLGINELGYDFEHTIARYEEEVLKLRQAQPEAEIILQANLHVTTKYSAENEIFNNDNINRMNESIRQIAEKYGFVYLDVNTLFDEESGGLNPALTYDQVHVLGKYYQQWADWILEEGMKNQQ